MIEIGTTQTLRAARATQHGMFLENAEGDDVLLPRKFVPEGLEEGQEVEVFVYTDSEDWPIATTQRPFVERDQFALLQVKEVSGLGAWLDMGLDKDLLVPFSEQDKRLETGKYYPVYVYVDPETDRMVASARLRRHLDTEAVTVAEGEEVELFITGPSDLGVKAIINGKHEGLIFESDIFRPIHAGDRLKGYVKKVREDRKIDLSLQPEGYAKVEPNAEQILEALRKADGFLPLHDKSDPELIRQQLHMSKKTFKKAIGGLYKQGLIALSDSGIRLK
ncbi:CvfB family protein [Phaeodactylibacter luteus]|uniref:GntR family transcriptional regulator n=1 Tax=Phaeodactylibacter luteus TaxID=1564516 RepID=A0A5C6RGP9_9BACT|nr:S1-like domain-containing RNA-binding protein [Phaeodactylibacter luteus]TXB61536.1 GntR family transcriptional regulator [Phaeodactylibacter luteus]